MTLDTKIYAIYKEGSPEPWGQLIQTAQNSKAKLTIQPVTEVNAGRYHCYTYTSGGWSQRSEALELVVTGEKALKTLSPTYDSQKKSDVTVSKINLPYKDRHVGKFILYLALHYFMWISSSRSL